MSTSPDSASPSASSRGRSGWAAAALLSVLGLVAITWVFLQPTELSQWAVILGAAIGLVLLLLAVGQARRKSWLSTLVLGLAGVLVVVATLGGSGTVVLLASVLLGLAGLLLLAASASRPWRWALALVALALGCLWWIGQEIPAPDDVFAQPSTPVRFADLSPQGVEGPTFASALHPAVETPSAVASSCGGSGCHGEQVSEHSGSAHALAGLGNPWYRATFDLARETLGPAGARWCAGCHTPDLVTSEALDSPLSEVSTAALAERPEAAGISCVACHQGSALSTLGQGHWQAGAAAATTSSSTEGLLRRWAIRLDPEPHRRAFGADSPATGLGSGSSETCATCHRAALHADFSGPAGSERFLTILDDFTTWQEGSMSGQSVPKALEHHQASSCVDCHMPALEEGGASHRFPGDNTALAALRGDEEQLRAVRDTLTSSGTTVDFIAVTEGTAIGEPLPERTVFESEPFYGPLDRIPPTVRRGESRRVDLMVTVGAVGHALPGGKSGSGDLWLEVTATDEDGRVLLANGVPGAGVPSGKNYRFDTYWMDSASQLVEPWRFWDAHTVVYLERYSPGVAKVVRYRLDIPPDAGSQIVLSGRLLHRGVSNQLNDWSFDRLGEPAPELPVTVLAETRQELEVLADGAEASASEPDYQPGDGLRLYRYGIARSLVSDHATARAIFPLVYELEPQLAAARVQMALAVPGFDPTREHLELARELEPDSPEVMAIWGGFSLADNRPEDALDQFQRLAADYPRSKEVLRGLGDAHFALRDFEAAIAAFEGALEVDPLDTAALSKLSQLYRVQGDEAAAERYQQLFETYRRDPGSGPRGFAFAKEHPEVQASWDPFFEHLDTAVSPAETMEAAAKP
ncbi:MAG: tetratricopeptide repeat protein [Acidobacteriota bacterium]